MVYIRYLWVSTWKKAEAYKIRGAGSRVFYYGRWRRQFCKGLCGAIPRPVAYIAISENMGVNEQKVIESVENKCKSLEKFAQPIRCEIEEGIARTKAGKKDYEYSRMKR